ncbi:MAG TPA: pentapeptide repeat-containing protein [Micromonosporaceae bacterium]
MRRFLRAMAAAVVIGVGTVAIGLLGAAPAVAAPVCPPHPAQLAGKHVASISDDDLTALTCANLRGANLDGLNLEDFDLEGANLTGASLVHTDLTQAVLSGATLTGANFTSAKLVQAKFEGDTATGANFSHANLEQADLKGANLGDANLTDAYLLQADLSGTDLRGATLTGANFEQATLTGTKAEPKVLKSMSAYGEPSSGIGGDGGHLALTLAPYIVTGAILLTVVLVRFAIQRGARSSYRPIIPPMTRQPYGAQPPFPGQPPYGAQPPFPGQPPFGTGGLPTTGAVPVQPTSPVQDAGQPYTPTTSFTTSDWQPPIVEPSNAEALHVIEEGGRGKRWFRR